MALNRSGLFPIGHTDSPIELTQAKLNILIAEDQLMNQKTIQFLFKKILPQAEPVIVSNGQLAVEAVKSCDKAHPFDIIILDDLMPQLPGNEAATQIRQYEIQENIPVAAMFTWSATYKQENGLPYFPEAIGALGNGKVIGGNVLMQNENFITAISDHVSRLLEATSPKSAKL